MTMTVGADINAHVWYDEKLNVIKIRIAGGLTSVNNSPHSKRGNPSLYKKLTMVLRDSGKKYPSRIL